MWISNSRAGYYGSFSVSSLLLRSLLAIILIMLLPSGIWIRSRDEIHDINICNLWNRITWSRWEPGGQWSKVLLVGEGQFYLFRLKIFGTNDKDSCTASFLFYEPFVNCPTHKQWENTIYIKVGVPELRAAGLSDLAIQQTISGQVRFRSIERKKPFDNTGWSKWKKVRLLEVEIGRGDVLLEDRGTAQDDR